jgi:GPH family glycoside/pentoside/hexuronide:cation symporter
MSALAASGSRVEAPARLGRDVLLAYSLPSVGIQFAFLLLGLYFLKFATDVMGIAAGVVGMLFAVSRLWDALADPIAGYLSDRTRSRFGRRRSWMAWSALPFGLAVWMLWYPPPGIQGVFAAAWVGAALLVFYSAYTALTVPYGALGAELSQDYHDRTRLFAWRQGIGAFGTLIGVGAYYLLLEAERGAGFSSRQVGLGVGVFASLCICVTTAVLVARVRERSDYQERGPERVFAAFGDVLRNPHAFRLLLVQGAHYFSVAVLSLVSAYVFQYVLHVPSGSAATMVACFAIGVVGAIPLWVVFSRRFGKHRCWSAALWLLSAVYALLFFVLDKGVSISGVQFAIACAVTLLVGALQSSNFVLSSSVQADVIDWDEVRTGERKEGAYLATWSFAEKAASALAAALVGVALEWVGYTPNVEQTESVRLMILGLMSFAPAVCHVVAALILMNFRLGEEEHARIRQELADRNHA